MMRFELVVIQGHGRKTICEGREIKNSNFTVADVHKILEVEQFLERLLGIRFHINQKEAGNDSKNVL